MNGGVQLESALATLSWFCTSCITLELQRWSEGGKPLPASPLGFLH